MNNRITMNHLIAHINRLNKATKNPLTEWERNADGKMKANVGCYHLDSAYGGYKLVQMDNDSGAIRTISQNGYTNKRDLLNQILAILSIVEK